MRGLRIKCEGIEDKGWEGSRKRWKDEGNEKETNLFKVR